MNLENLLWVVWVGNKNKPWKGLCSQHQCYPALPNEPSTNVMFSCRVGYELKRQSVWFACNLIGIFQ